MGSYLPGALLSGFDQPVSATIQPHKSGLLAVRLFASQFLTEETGRSTERVFDLGMDVAGTHRTSGSTQDPLCDLRDHSAS